MASSLKQRRKADAVRFVYDATMPEMLLEQLRKRLGFGRYDSLIPAGDITIQRITLAFLMQDQSIWNSSLCHPFESLSSIGLTTSLMRFEKKITCCITPITHLITLLTCSRLRRLIPLSLRLRSVSRGI